MSVIPNKKIDKKIAMLLLSIYPLLYYYTGPANLSYGHYLLFIYITFLIIKYNSYRILTFPISFFMVWGMATISIWYNSSDLKISYFIPGGVNFCSWAVFFGFTSYFFSLNYLRKYMRIIFLVSSVIFILQIIASNVGRPFCAVLPLSSHISYGDLSFDQLVQIHISRDRYSSLFMEPAYFAQYLIVHLCIELFSDESSNKIFNKYSILIIIVLLLMRSGSGYIGVFSLLFMKLMVYLSNKRIVWRIGFVLLMAPVVYYALSNYAETEIGIDVYSRTTEIGEDGTSGYIRIVQGFIVYDYLPIENKIFGISDEQLYSLNVPFLNKDDSSFLFNGIQMILIKTGLFGLVLFILFYVNLFRNNKNLARVSVLLLLLLSCIEQTYLMPLMLILTTISYGCIINKSIVETT